MSDPNLSPLVLIVDDDPHMLSVISKSLEIVGKFRVEMASDGAAGLEKYFTVNPDCVIIDVKMPELDGYQLVRALRGDPGSLATPLVILTAMAQEKDKFKGLASGADTYLLKPVKPTDLVEAVRRALRISKIEREQFLRSFAEEPPTP